MSYKKSLLRRSRLKYISAHRLHFEIGKNDFLRRFVELTILRDYVFQGFAELLFQFIYSSLQAFGVGSLEAGWLFALCWPQLLSLSRCSIAALIFFFLSIYSSSVILSQKEIMSSNTSFHSAISFDRHQQRSKENVKCKTNWITTRKLRKTQISHWMYPVFGIAKSWSISTSNGNIISLAVRDWVSRSYHW